MLGITRISEIKALLTQQAEAVCRQLLPHGKRRGKQWVCGDIRGAAGDSTVIELEGPKAGVWADFASSEGGDLFDLWMKVKNQSFREAFVEVKKHLGLHIPESSPRKKYSGKPNKLGCTGISKTPVEQYLINERSLTSETLAAFKIGMKTVGAQHEIIFPIMAADGRTVINLKHLGLERVWNPGKNEWEKQSRQEKDCPPGLFGWQAFERDQTVAIITEGEIDCMTWWTWGYHCVLSIPMGSSNDGWIDWDWENLEPFETIFLNFDNDEPGQKAALKAAHRLGLHRCRIVLTPPESKDANACLQNGATVQDAARWLHESRYVSPGELKCARDFRDQIHNLINPAEDESEIGLKTPLFGRRLRFRPGEMTLWTGHTSHGKSTLLNQIMLYALMAQQRVAIGSFEIKGPVTIKNLIHSLTLLTEPTMEQVDQAIDWFGEKLWIYDMIGLAKRPRLLELMSYSVMRHGVHHIVIDSIMKCDISSEDYEAQRQFVNELHCFCHDHHVHVHLVGHPRKGKDDDDPPGIMDVHGGQSVIGQPDNVICVWRNKTKEKNREKLTDHQANMEPDSVAFVNKQRFTGEEFKERLWFKKGWRRFTTHYGEGEPKFEDFGIVKVNDA